MSTLSREECCNCGSTADSWHVLDDVNSIGRDDVQHFALMRSVADDVRIGVTAHRTADVNVVLFWLRNKRCVNGLLDSPILGNAITRHLR